MTSVSLFMLFSGLAVEYDLSKRPGHRVSRVLVRCLKCDVPSYSPLDNMESYNVFVGKYLIQGGDGYSFSPLEHHRFGKCSHQ